MYILWVCGVAALGVIAATTGLVLAAKRRRKEEKQRHAEQVHRQNERQRLVERMKLLLAFEQKQADVSSLQMDAKIERMEAEEERRYQQQARTPAILAFDMAKWKQQDYAASARWEREQAQTKGIGAALGLLGGLVQAAQERYRALDAKIEREEQKEEAAWEAWKSRSQTLAIPLRRRGCGTCPSYASLVQSERLFL